MSLQIGDTCQYEFSVSNEDMASFARMSDDSSDVHTSSAFATDLGYKDVIVYGGIILAKLSHVLGMKIPGPKGVSMSWQIDYREPLYVDEQATILLKVVDVSQATGVVSAKFKVTSEKRLIASGKTQSFLSSAKVG